MKEQAKEVLKELRRSLPPNATSDMVRSEFNKRMGQEIQKVAQLRAKYSGLQRMQVEVPSDIYRKHESLKEIDHLLEGFIKEAAIDHALKRAKEDPEIQKKVPEELRKREEQIKDLNQSDSQREKLANLLKLYFALNGKVPEGLKKEDAQRIFKEALLCDDDKDIKKFFKDLLVVSHPDQGPFKDALPLLENGARLVDFLTGLRNAAFPASQ